MKNVKCNILYKSYINSIPHLISTNSIEPNKYILHIPSMHHVHIIYVMYLQGVKFY